MAVVYELIVELIDADGEIVDTDHFYSEAQFREAVRQGYGSEYVLRPAIVRDSTIEGREWAYFGADGKPGPFVDASNDPTGRKLPKRFAAVTLNPEWYATPTPGACPECGAGFAVPDAPRAPGGACPLCSAGFPEVVDVATGSRVPAYRADRAPTPAEVDAPHGRCDECGGAFESEAQYTAAVAATGVGAGVADCGPCRDKAESDSTGPRYITPVHHDGAPLGCRADDTDSTGPRYIVAWVRASDRADNYATYESLTRARAEYDHLRDGGDTYSVTLAVVLESTDYDTHPAVRHLAR